VFFGSIRVVEVEDAVLAGVGGMSDLMLNGLNVFCRESRVVEKTVADFVDHGPVNFLTVVNGCSDVGR
jgi:hypothetical protein